MIEIQLPFFYRLFISQSLCKETIQRVLIENKENDEKGLTLVFTNNSRIRKLNREYRKIDRPTDVLSFSLESTLKGEDNYLGDIIISLPKAISQASEHHHSVKNELCLLMVHGTLHLLGFDHMDENSKKKMWKIQEKILLDLGIQTAQLEI